MENGKSSIATMEYTFMIYSLDGKGMVFRKVIFQIGNRHGERL